MTSESRVRELINRTHKHGVAIGHKINELTHVKQVLEKLNADRRRELREAKPKGFTMYDSTEVNEIPKKAEAVAGYVGGNWPTYKELVIKYPKAKKLSIAINSKEDAGCLDVEQGDANPSQVPAWVKRQKRLGAAKPPCIYASLDTMPAVKMALAKAGIKRDEVRLWVAHYTYSPHIPPGFEACQYTDKALGRNLDASLCLPGFL